MAKLTGTGAPSRNTAGALGDIYTDTQTGAQYICTFAYRIGSEGAFDCTWKLVEGEEVEIPKAVEEKKEEVPMMKDHKNEETPAKPIEEKKEEVSAKPVKNRTNYTNYSKK